MRNRIHSRAIGKVGRIGALVCILLIISVSGLMAAATTTGNLKLIAALTLEAKIEGGLSFRTPVLQGDGPLFSGNNLRVRNVLGISPVAATYTVDAILTPIAVAEVNLGGAVGTGWSFPPMDLDGLK